MTPQQSAQIIEDIRYGRIVSDDGIFFLKKAIVCYYKHEKDPICIHPFDKVESVGANHKCTVCNQVIK